MEESHVRIELLSEETGVLIQSFDVPKQEYQGLLSPDVFSVRVSRKTAASIIRNINAHN